MLERFMARLGYTRTAVFAEAMEQQSAALEAAWAETDRVKAKYTGEILAAKQELAQAREELKGRTRVVGHLLTEIGDRDAA